MSLNVEFDFLDWHMNKASCQERRLLDKMYDFMDYFNDMTFSPGSVTSKFTEVFEVDDSEASGDCLIPDELGDNFT